MEDIGSAIDGIPVEIAGIRKIYIIACLGRQDGSRFIEIQDLLLVIRPLFSVILVLVRLPVQPFTQLAPPTAVHDGSIPVLAEVLSDIILVGVKIDDDDRLAEGGSPKGQQQQDGSIMTEHTSQKNLGKGKGEGAKILRYPLYPADQRIGINVEYAFSISFFDEQALGGCKANGLLAVVIIHYHRSVKRFDGLYPDLRSQPNIPTVEEFQEFRRGVDDS